MKINRIELIKAIEKLKGLAKQNKIRPILEGIMLKSDNGILKAISTDLSSSFIINLGNIDTIEQITVVFNPALVLEYIKQLEDEYIEIFVNESTMIVSGAEFVIYDYSEFPTIKIDYNEENRIKVNSNEFCNNLQKVETSASIQDNLALECVRLSSKENKINLIASDTFRMFKVEQNIESNIKIDCSIPKSVLKCVYDILSEEDFINIVVDKNFIIFYNSNSILKIRLIELEFPNWQNIINQFNSEIEIELNTDDINKALKRINIFNRDNQNTKYGAIFEFVNNKVEIRGMCEKGKNKEKIETIKNGNDIKINLNSKFFLDFVSKTSTSSIILKLSKNNSPVLLKTNKDDGTFYLMMPIAMIEQ